MSEDPKPVSPMRLPPPLPARAPVPVQVLGYATPVSRRELRKPVRTRIVREPAPEGVAFVEVSDEKAKAVVVMACCLVPLFTLSLNARAAFSTWKFRRAPEELFIGLFVSAIILLLLGMIAAVIDQVWRRTTLAARNRELALSIASPFRSSSRAWPADEVVDLRPWPIRPGVHFGEPLCELQVRLRSNPTLQLFRNYGQSELRWIADELGRSLGELSAAAGDPPSTCSGSAPAPDRSP